MKQIKRILQEQPHGDPYKRHTMIAILNIIVNNPHVRSLVEKHVAPRVGRQLRRRMEKIPDPETDESEDEILSTYPGILMNLNLLVVKMSAFGLEKMPFLEEFCRMDEAAQLAINQHDSSALVVLGKNGWARMPDSVNRAVSIALDDGGGPQAIKTLKLHFGLDSILLSAADKYFSSVATV